ncbi:MAG: pyridoxal 5'-phosphate synthase glutaminase subunit PdxT [Candidatus Thermoplasmatota archaeon]|jgi:5'-phosphate synthase pdxT subunit|nr:pyridoxal 5'-phosphate synthase glutaminase subunit PdxT [Candidatus Thermoplasmatota archaeon]
MVNIGIIGYQGDVSEHVEILHKLSGESRRDIDPVLIREKKSLKSIAGLIIPGGESTTIYKLLKDFDLFDSIKLMVSRGLHVMGTCAGLILISKDDPASRVRGMGILDVSIKRNAYGRQIDSFTDYIDIEGIGKFNAVFIRAPVIERVGNVLVLAKHRGLPVMVRSEKVIGLTFHPELTGDTRVHEYFIETIGREGYASTPKRKWVMEEFI